jgi:hypothetical protein
MKEVRSGTGCKRAGLPDANIGMRRSCGATIPTVGRRAVGLRSILIVAVMHRTTCANVPATRPPTSREIAIEMSFV